jgi:transposase-like protein
MGRRGYPAEFRRKVLDLVESGRPVADVAKALGISDQTIYTWRREVRMRGPRAGTDLRGEARAGGRQAADRRRGG